MIIKQISVLIENDMNRLYDVCSLLAANEVNIRAITVSDTADFGIIRMVVNDPNKAFAVLTGNNFTVKVIDVLGIEVADTPGGLTEVLSFFKQHGIDIEYLYATLEHNQEKAVVIFKVNDIEKGITLMKQASMNTVFKLL